MFGGKMESRKIIGFGNSSYVISLPKSWVSRNKLRKGDTIYLDEKIDDLVITTSETPKKEEKEVIINIDDKNIDEIKREIANAYIHNNHTIIILGKNVEKLSQTIREDMIHNLMALEIIEQTSNRIITKDFLDMDQIKIIDLVRQIDIIIRSIMMDTKNRISNDLYKNIMERDKNINRLSFLAFRAIKYALENPNVAKKQKLDYPSLLNYWLIIVYLEEIADELKRFVRYLLKIKLKKKEFDVLIQYYGELVDCYMSTFKFFYTQNKKEAYKMIQKRNNLIKSINLFCETYSNKKEVPFVTEKMKAIIFLIHKINKITFSV